MGEKVTNYSVKSELKRYSEKNIIQNNTQYNPNFPQTSNKSAVLPVGFIQTAQTSQSQTLALSSS